MDSRRDEPGRLPPKTEWRTPLQVFNWVKGLYRIDFDLDPCTSEDNPLGTPLFYTVRTDGLAHSWRGRKAFVNPPYGREISLWIDKAIKEVLDNPDDPDLEIVMLLPSATDTKWFKRLTGYAEIRFITTRIGFTDEEGWVVGNARGGYLLAYLTPWTPDVDVIPTIDLLGEP